MKQLFLKKFFSRTCSLRGKKDVQLNFDDLYICYVRKIDVVQRTFVLVFTKGTTFPQEIFLRGLYIQRKKWCTIELWWLIYMLYEKNWCCSKKFCVSFYKWNHFSQKNFSPGLVHLEKKNYVSLTFDGSYICYVNKIDVFQSSFILVSTNGTTFP